MRCLKTCSTAVVALSLFLSGGSLAAKKKDKHDDAKTGTHVAVDIFIGSDREIIQHYFVSNAGSLPPGLAKRGGDLPPGLQKQLRKKGRLPPGLEKKIVPFPVELEGRLAPLKPDFSRGFIEGRAVIYNRKTSVVFDIFAVL